MVDVEVTPAGTRITATGITLPRAYGDMFAEMWRLFGVIGDYDITVIQDRTDDELAYVEALVDPRVPRRSAD